MPAETRFLQADGWQARLTVRESAFVTQTEPAPTAEEAQKARDWWDDEVTKLRRAASHPRWRVREMVAAALQRMLAADWQRTYQVLTNWLLDDDPLVIRACAAAIAEPPLLKNTARGDGALFIQARAVEWLARLPQERRREEAVGVLRKALGYTLSVATAATPEAGSAPDRVSVAEPCGGAQAAPARRCEFGASR